MRVFVLSPRENWIVDRLAKEWHKYNADITVDDPCDADIIWLMADWCWAQVPEWNLSQKKVIVSVHHLVPEKFDDVALLDFHRRDQYVDAYHVPCEKTAEQIRSLTRKPIWVKPFWVNQLIWHQVPETLRSQLGIDVDTFLIGSFQRDTEGRDLVSPKLEKGPDRFCDAVEVLAQNWNVEVLLGGWRRQYVIRRLKAAGIKYYYWEFPNFDQVNRMYNALDLYIVGARYEGGPQSIVECAATRTPIVSTDVGLASEILHPNMIWSSVDELPGIVTCLSEEEIEYAYEKVSKFFIPQGFEPFLRFLESI